ncbi:ICAM1 protein, partial [Certhia brachydactyla]|nr:ICAM1 protein [Certhia brachydactyla]
HLACIFLVIIPLFPPPFPYPYPTFPAAPPRLDSAGCPGQQNWTEGEEGILQCQARGRPRPRLSCSRSDGDSLTAGTPRPAARGHAGTYRCRATNELGTAERNVTL